MDGSWVRRFVREVRETLAGAFVRQVEPVADGMLLVLEAPAAERRLELGLVAAPGAAWAYLLGPGARQVLHDDIAPVQPDLASPLAALAWRDPAATPLDALRAWMVRPAMGHPGFERLVSSRLVDIAARGTDRVLRLDLEVSGALGERQRCVLHCELFDRGGNVLLLGAEGEELANWRGRPVSAERADGVPAGEEASLAWDPGRGLHTADKATGPGLGLVAAAHLAFAARAAEEMGMRHARGLRRDEGRLARLLAKLEAEAAGAAESERWRQMGELLAANQHRVRRGQARVTVEDFFAGGSRRDIDLEPTLSPQENVALFFKRARRAERGQATIGARRDATRADLERVRAALAARQSGSTWADVLEAASDAWREGCPEAARTPLPALWAPGGPGWRATSRAAAAEEARAEGPGRRFVLPGDWEVRVGRSNSENDELTHRFARPEDIWLHASGVPGSHVVLRMHGRSDNPPREVLEAAAAIAARFSKAKHAGTVPVVWTRKRYVRKPRGAKPGLAVCSQEKTLFVRPGLPAGAED